MKYFLVLFVMLFSCVKKPAIGSVEWTATQYSGALLQTNYDEMRKYATPESVPPLTPESLKSRLAGLHVVKHCPLHSNAEKTSYTTLILFAGGMDDSVYGVEVTTIKKETGWQVEKASYSLDAKGAPKRYLRNCADDESAEKKPVGL